MHTEVSSKLFNLIHAMNKGEKRYFKLYLRSRSPHKRAMNYLRLFDAMAKQEEHNEEKICRQVIVNKKHLRILKHRLHHLILESLRTLDDKGDDIDNKLKNTLHNARIMRGKGFAEEEMRFLIKAKELALKHERWGAAIEAIGREIRIKRGMMDNKLQQGLEKEMKILLNKLTNLAKYRKINREVTALTHKSGIQRTAVNKTLHKMIQHPLLTDANKGISAEAKELFYNTLVYYYLFIEDYSKAEKILLSLMPLIESGHSTFEFSETAHSTALNCLAIVQCELGKYREAFPTIKKHRSLLNSQSPSVQSHVFLFSCINETNYYLLTKEFEKGAAVIKNMGKALDKFIWKPMDIRPCILYYNMGSIYFGAGQYRQSLAWINKIIHHPQKTLLEDMQAWARILQILIHYELNTPDITPHLVVSAYRFLLRRKLLYKTEKSILLFIRRLNKIDSSKNILMEEFGKFRDELVQITKNPEEKKTLKYFDLISWLESKIENRPFAEVVRRTC